MSSCSEFVRRFNQSYFIIRQVSASVFYKRIDFHLIHNTATVEVTQITKNKILRFPHDDNDRLNSYNMVNYKVD